MKTTKRASKRRSGTGNYGRDRRRRWWWLAMGGIATLALGPARGDEMSVRALKELSLEELTNLSVTSTSKKQERVAVASAAVDVLTPGELLRAGARTLPEALRLVPGLAVARVNGNDWAISSRGFNDTFANKLLVMVDGRTVYTPLFSGVYWQMQDVLLEDLARIEVVRGPGGALWGANAVNGVINIISKPAKDTQGVLMSGGAGTEALGFGQVRYGAQVSENSWGRVYVKTGTRDNTPLSNGDPANDRATHTQGGFRYDWQPETARTFTLQGDVYGGRYDQTFIVPTATAPYRVPVEHQLETMGANGLARWTQEFSADSILRVQAYFDHAQQQSRPMQAGLPNIAHDESVNTLDLDVQQQWRWGERNDLVAGGGYRMIGDEFEGTPRLTLNPTDRTVSVFNTFVQDELKLVPDTLSLIAGTKLEHNDMTGWQLQPSGRLRWTPTDNQTLWGGVSRASRTPSRAEQDLVRPSLYLPGQFPGQPPTALVFRGSREFDAENLTAYEIGYRVRPWKPVSFDVALFLNDYEKLRTLEPGPADLSTLPDYVTIPVRPGNLMEGRTYGTELSVRWEPVSFWQLRVGYTYLGMELHTEAGSGDTVSTSASGSSPRHQVQVHSSLDLSHDVQFDAFFRWIDALPALGVDAYPSLDLRLAWSPRPGWQISVVGQNLLDNRHAEFGGISLGGSFATEVPRSVYGKLSFQF